MIDLDVVIGCSLINPVDDKATNGFVGFHHQLLVEVSLGPGEEQVGIVCDFVLGPFPDSKRSEVFDFDVAGSKATIGDPDEMEGLGADVFGNGSARVGVGEFKPEGIAVHSVDDELPRA